MCCNIYWANVNMQENSNIQYKGDRYIEYRKKEERNKVNYMKISCKRERLHNTRSNS